MRISHEHRFIFFSVPRTASSSIRRSLDKYANLRSVHISETTEENPFYHHITPEEVKIILERRGIDYPQYRRFCFVRNPYDRVVSLWRLYCERLSGWETKKSILSNAKSVLRKFIIGTPTFEQFVESIDPKGDLTTSVSEFITSDKGEMMVGSVLKYEELPNNLINYMNKIGIKMTSDDIPHIMKSEKRSKYQIHHTDKTKRIVKSKYRQDIEQFNYTF